MGGAGEHEALGGLGIPRWEEQKQSLDVLGSAWDNESSPRWFTGCAPAPGWREGEGAPGALSKKSFQDIRLASLG